VNIAQVNSSFRKTLLVVDDMIESLTILVQVLGKHYRIRVATSGKAALRQIELETPDLVLLDVEMPDMDGFDVCKIMKDREQTREIPVIFLTGVTDDSSKERGLRLGAADFLNKPVDFEILISVISRHLDTWGAIESREVAAY
jgi:PleD family two-component response regulator